MSTAVDFIRPGTESMNKDGMINNNDNKYSYMTQVMPCFIGSSNSQNVTSHLPVYQ